MNEKDKAMLNEILSAQGYIVMASHTRRDIGAVYPIVRVSQDRYLAQPYCVIAESTYQEWVMQAERFMRAKGYPINPDVRRSYYYRIIYD